MLFRYRGKLHKIIKADGPERIEAEWWLQDGQHRDYYCVEDEDGLRFARQQKILCQGRGSAANSTVCYCLGITSVDPTKFDLLFSGKTTLIKIILGKLETETVHRANNRSVYIDQDYSLIDNKLKVYEQVQQFNTSALQEHEIKIRLTRFLFTKEDWDKPFRALSGGEKMRLMLCCLNIHNQSPDIIILDESTNNLDLRNIEILTAAINEYQGTLIVVSHDDHFLEQINIERIIEL